MLRYLFLTGTCLLTLPSIKPVSATPVTSGKSGRVTQNATVLVNGRVVNFDTNLEMRNGRLYVPLRAISEAAGAKVSYNADTREINIQREMRGVYYKPPSNSPRVLVPLRFISENLGATISVNNNNGVLLVKVDWPKEDQRVFTRPSSSNSSPPANSTTPSRPAPVSSPPANSTTPRPAPVDGKAIAAAMQHNLNKLNAYRARHGAPALQMDKSLNDFALQGSIEFAKTQNPHAHFAPLVGAPNKLGFVGVRGENQSVGYVPAGANGLNKVVDDALQVMMDEGPGGGKRNHYDNIVDPRFRRVGIGLAVVDGKLWFTNDFSE